MSVYVITHKKTDYPIIKNYKILLVGACRGHICGDFFDDSGDNISEKNPYFCELTGLYWIWKNVQDDYIGISHYRRFFSKSLFRNRFLSERSIEKKLKKYDMILPNIVNIFRPVKEELFSIYKNYSELQTIVRNSVAYCSPEYLSTYDRVMEGTETYFCNMLICSKELFDDYCAWLFKILFYIEDNVNMDGYNNYQKRLYGFISERLLTVWVKKNRLHVCELGVVNTEKFDERKELLKGLRRVYSYYITESRFTKNIIDKIRKKIICL